MARHTESKCQQAFIRWWDLAHRSLGVPDKRLLFAIPNGGARNAVTGAVLKAEGVRRGVPDLFLAVPRVGKCDEWIADDLPKVTLKQFHGLFLEFKTWMGRVTADQEQMHSSLRGQDYAVAVVRGFDQAERAIKQYLRGETVNESEARWQIESKELAEMREDKARLDWLEKTETSIGFYVECTAWGAWRVDFEGSYEDTIREAIDAARRGGGNG